MSLPDGRRLPPFAPPYPRTLAAPFRGAKSSHSRRRLSPSLPPGGALSLLPAPRKPLQLRSGEQNLHISAARFLPLCRPAALSLCSPLPANPCSSVPGSKIFTFPPSDFDLPGARRRPLFAPRSPQTLAAPFRGAKSSHSRRRISPSLCSTLPANPCSSISGSKIFTFPPPNFAFLAARRRPLFAPLYPLTLVAPFRGAKSSHSRRRISCSLPLGGSFSLLPPPRKPLQLRFGEQNLHISAVGFRPPRRSAALSLCSPLPANPCSSVPGSKIFTFPPSDFALSAARRRPLFAPRSPRTLVTPFRGAKSSHSRRRISTSQALGGSFSLLPPPREPLWLRFGEQNLHISAVGFRPPCRPVALSLCSPLPANPCSSVPGSKIFTFPPPDFSLTAVWRLYASKGATANPRKTKVTPPPIVFFLYKFKKRPF